MRCSQEGEDWEGTRGNIEGLMNAFDLPPGYSWSCDDRILEQSEEDQQMGINFSDVLAIPAYPSLKSASIARQSL